jgi:hypothetical protein
MSLVGVMEDEEVIDILRNEIYKMGALDIGYDSGMINC